VEAGRVRGERDPDAAADEDDATRHEAASPGSAGVKRGQPLLSPSDFGTAVGAAMLGFEQALRSQPPPEVMAAEHRPIRGLTAEGDELELVFPDDGPDRVEQPDPAA
jgi:hypothetical protein